MCFLCHGRFRRRAKTGIATIPLSVPNPSHPPACPRRPYPVPVAMHLPAAALPLTPSLQTSSGSSVLLLGIIEMARAKMAVVRSHGNCLIEVPYYPFLPPLFLSTSFATFKFLPHRSMHVNLLPLLWSFALWGCFVNKQNKSKNKRCKAKSYIYFFPNEQEFLHKKQRTHIFHLECNSHKAQRLNENK